MDKEFCKGVSMILPWGVGLAACCVAHYWGSYAVGGVVLFGCYVSMAALEQSMKDEVAQAESDAHHARQDAQREMEETWKLRDRYAEEREAVLADNRRLEMEGRTLLARNAELEAKIKKYEARFAELKEAAELREEIEDSLDPEEPGRLLGGEVSIDDLVDRALYRHL